MFKEKIPILSIKVASYEIPTETPESDGTIEWKSTTLVVVWLNAGGLQGVGYTYCHASASLIIQTIFKPLLLNADALEIPLLWKKMVDSVRNIGRPGLASCAISAVDIALWDLKAKLLQVPLCKLWGMAKKSMPIYGSGGFTSYTTEQLVSQFERWKALGVTEFKMKVGRFPNKDLKRVELARQIIGPSCKLFVDANGAYSRKQALDFSEKFSLYNVTWFEEPVSADDLEGLHLLRDQSPKSMNIVGGEYGYDHFYFKTMLENQTVDILQADATRCGGYTGFFQACQLSESFSVPLSSHTAPSLHLHPCLSQNNLCNMEFFYDHERIEQRYFEGFPKQVNGQLFPHLDRNGHGLELKEREINNYLMEKMELI